MLKIMSRCYFFVGVVLIIDINVNLIIVMFLVNLLSLGGNIMRVPKN